MPIDLGTKSTTVTTKRQIVSTTIETPLDNQMRVHLTWVEQRTFSDGSPTVLSEPRMESFTQDQCLAMPGFQAAYATDKPILYALLATRVN